MKPKIYNKYPSSTVFTFSLLQSLTSLAGLYIMVTLNIFTGILFLFFIFLLEYSVYKEGCRYCVYYGGGCASGKGKIAKLFFKKGDPKKFGKREITWKDFVPQILFVLIPIIVGITLLISRGLNILILAAIIYELLSWFAINPFLYGKLACPNCKQGKKCCPALKFFTKKS